MAMTARVTAVLNQTKAKYVDTAQKDILLALQQFPELVPDSEYFVLPDGTRRLAFRLKGTVPVLYCGNTYNIPVALYLSDTHPYYAPTCFVCPTSSMMVKESKNVDKQGRIFLPYLSDWRFPGYDLNGLLQVMVMCFQESCPVFAKPSSQSSHVVRSSHSASSYTPYPLATSSGIPPYPVSSQPQDPYSPFVNPYPVAYQNSAQLQGSGTIQPEHFKASLLTAVEDKIRMRLREKFGTVLAELASIQQTRSDLRTGQNKLKAMIERLESEQKSMENTLITYQEKKNDLSKILNSCPSDGEIDFDSVIEASTPLYRQLVDCYVYDCAVDDTIYFLGQALKRNRISLPNYLKEVRQLSRKQFIKRATVQKCRQKAKLPT
ncbi:hypothetical protein AB6A40_008531 [Gnathostoma spinigerum]|uniref:Tumor susceptibility gene 101 protein n=1 Tax=Gnathostoma spinigerum TaxID=75299 RepID=A0ABD6ERP9_9BILA